MQDIKTFEHTINVKSPCTFISNKRVNIFNELATRYVNKCWQGFYILKILDLVDISSCRSINSNPQAICIINVRFKALVLFYNPGDIISNITICISEGQVCGIGDNINIAFSKSSNNKLLVDGQLVPIRLGGKIHNKPLTERINALGSILLPTVETPIYKLEGVLDLTTEKYNKIFKNYIDEINKQEDDLDKKESQFFIKLLNTYDTIPAKNKNEGINIITLLKEAQDKPVTVTGYWTKNLKSNCDSLLYYKREKTEVPTENIPIINGFISMIQYCYSMRKGIIEMGNIYDIKEKNNVIWELMKRNKLS